jgi:uncharacterized protein YoxC
LTISLIDISVLVIAVAFGCLVFYLITALKAVRGSLEQLSKTMVHMQGQIEDVSRETTELLKNTNEITLDVQKKSKSLDSLFESVDNVGVAVKQITNSAKEVSTTLSQSLQYNVTNKAAQNQDKISEIIRLTSVGLNLWKKWQAHKESKQHTKEYGSENGHKHSETTSEAK